MARIGKVLVANRGEIAARVMRTAREMDIATVAVHSDADAGAPYVQLADEAVRLPGNTPAETYLRGDLLLRAAAVTGADAVHPGYGFLSENAGFAQAVTAAGLTWVGPPASAITAMGSKIAAKQLMSDAGVPVLPGITVDELVADDIAGVADRVQREIGFPALVKAAFGGGGRGMRVVHDAEAVAEAVAGARREAAAAFGDPTVFVERYVQAPRHIEVQIFGDVHGTMVHLFERECSIQRRYQKVIEEAPSSAIDDALRERLGSAAVAAGRAIGYVGAGTVEFVLDQQGRFYFLEVNTRLQVEHPVTEMITGLDLVRLQFLVAEGLALPDTARRPTRAGHAIEARLYAEDTAAGFLPATGTVHTFRVPELTDVRVDAGVADGSTVSVYYDSMLAKIIAYGPTRDEACRRLARALSETRVHGVVTNRDLLVGILREPEFRAGRIDTGYLTRHDPVALAAAQADPSLPAAHALAAALAGQAGRRSAATVQPTVPSGWRNVPNGRQQVEFRWGELTLEVRYGLSRGTLRAAVNGAEMADLALRSAAPDRVVLDIAGVCRALDVAHIGDTWYVDSPLGHTALVEVPRFPDPTPATAPGTLLAAMPGGVVRVPVRLGDRVTPGTPIVVLEAMKMEHTVTAPHDGIVTELAVSVGSQVEAGAVLAVVDQDGSDGAATDMASDRDGSTDSDGAAVVGGSGG